MNPLRLIVFLLFLSLFACKQPEVVKSKPNPLLQKTWKTFGLAGQPQKITEFNYKQFVPDSLLEDVITRENYSFDENGNLTRRETFGEGQLIQYSNSYEYDMYGNAIKVTTANPQGRTTNVHENILDSMGNIKAVKNTTREGKLIYHVSYKYDSHGNPIEWKQEEPTLPIVYKRKYEYDSKGRSTIREDVTGGKHQIKEVLSYDSSNAITTVRYVDGTLDNTTIEKFDDQHRLLLQQIQFRAHVQQKNYQYDTHGNITEYLRRWDNTIDSVYSYRASYTFDSQGNWITRTKVNLDGSPRASVERRIEY